MFSAPFELLSLKGAFFLFAATSSVYVWYSRQAVCVLYGRLCVQLAPFELSSLKGAFFLNQQAGRWA